MELPEILSTTTDRALAFYGDAYTPEFYRRLGEKRLSATRCKGCGEPAFPPRPFCPFCHAGEVEWFDLPRRGTLYAFTQQDRSVRFRAPDVIGLVELEVPAAQGSRKIKFLSRIDAPIETLKIGQAVEVDFIEVHPGLLLHQFRPV